ncbi:hypothetical protein [Burkholderia stagnalis]|uniref:hypothetical protein n=1 Tax=Burkholderia stagnalis TaxID=1503054 RepID=UPI000AB004CB|nr:hypothetical protein [Burkholderia stagnalis]VWB34273.1 hypothetical protein BST28156_01522 [Burkholderia stagnalis]
MQNQDVLTKLKEALQQEDTSVTPSIKLIGPEIVLQTQYANVNVERPSLSGKSGA